jgi:DNA-binding PadR family transcriptional regulator
MDQVPQSYLRACALLLISEEATHGYELVDRLGHLGIVHLDAGRLYRTLRAMEDEGLLRSSWEQGGSGPTRHRYWVTDEGVEHLQDCAQAVADNRRNMLRYLARFNQLAGRTEPGGLRTSA